MLYITRHGRTDWNKSERLQGQIDIPLNAEGRRMALDAGAKYQDLHIDTCYCSPLSRARETAELFLSARPAVERPPILTDARLIEMGFGIYEGTENYFHLQGHPITPLYSDPAHYQTVEGGESLDALYARTGSFLNEVLRPAVSAGQDILVVGHGAMCCALIGQIRGLPRERFWDALLKNCEIASFAVC